MKVSVRQAGTDFVLPEISAMLSRISPEKLAEIARPALKPMAEAMRRGAPQRRGKLARSIRVYVRKATSRREASIFVGPSSALRHIARFLEYGTSRMAPRPFIRSAISGAEGPALQAIDAALTKAVRGGGR